MSRDWPDPRVPDKPVSAFELALATIAVLGGYVAMDWGAIEALSWAIS